MMTFISECSDLSDVKRAMLLMLCKVPTAEEVGCEQIIWRGMRVVKIGRYKRIGVIVRRGGDSTTSRHIEVKKEVWTKITGRSPCRMEARRAVWSDRERGRLSLTDMAVLDITSEFDA